MVTPLKPYTTGDVVKIKCKLHGNPQLIAGLDFPVALEPSCPYCLRTMTSGKRMCGEGFLDERGVAYVVDVHGNLRKVQDLREDQVQKIQGRRKMIRKVLPFKKPKEKPKKSGRNK